MSDPAGKRPWLAALLGTIATGLGHFYLRRWRRGLGWFVFALLVSLVFVPADAAQALLEGRGDPATLLPVFAVGIASVADAYVLARRSRARAESRGRVTAGAGAPSERQAGADGASDPADGMSNPADGDPAASAGPTGAAGPGDAGACPNCGKELDPDLDFCPWCTTRLDP